MSLNLNKIITIPIIILILLFPIGCINVEDSNDSTIVGKATEAIFDFYGVDNSPDFGSKTQFTQTNNQGPPTYTLTVQNPIEVKRENEVIKYKLELNDKELDANNVLFNIVDANGNEVLSDYFQNSIETYASNYVKSLEIIFQDDFGPGDLKEYTIQLNVESTSSESVIQTNTINDWRFNVDNNIFNIDVGAHEIDPLDIDETYTFDDTVTFLSIGHPSEGIVFLLDPFIMGNIFDPDNDYDPPQYDFYYGEPTLVSLDYNKILARLEFEYKEPFYIEMTEDDKFADGSWDLSPYLSTRVVVEIYNNRQDIYTYTKHSVKQQFWGHNYFTTGRIFPRYPYPVAGLSAYFVGFESDPMLIQSTDDHPKGSSIFDGTYYQFYTSNNEGKEGEIVSERPLSEWQEYIVVKGAGNKGIFVYTPDWKNTGLSNIYHGDTIFGNECDGYYTYDGCDHWIVNVIYTYAGSLAYTISTTGMGSGWIPSPIPAKTYANRMHIFYDEPYNSKYVDTGTIVNMLIKSDDLDEYEENLIILENPLIVDNEPIDYTGCGLGCQFGYDDIEGRYFCPSDCAEYVCGDYKCKVGLEDNHLSDFYCEEDCFP